MSEKMEDCKVSLLPRNVNNSAEFTLKIPNFFCLPEYDGTEYDMKSPCFEFANATWRFQCQSRKTEMAETGNCIKEFDLYMEKLSFEISEQIIFYMIYLLNADDKRNKYFSDSGEFDENNNRILMRTVYNDEPSYDTRNTLTFIIQLIGESRTNQVPLTPVPTVVGDESLSEDLKKLLLNGKHHDLTLKVAGKEFRVHQDILMARSQVFQAMLSHDMTEKKEGSIDVPDCEPECMEQFLLYVYSGKVEKWNLDNALGLYYLSDKYNTMPLKRKCSRFLKNSLSTSGISDVLKLALNHDDSDLLECATEYFLNHTSEVLPTVGWISFVHSNSVAANELFIKASKKWDRATS